MQINPEVVGKLLRQHWQAENDTNGNPRRLWLLMDAQTGNAIWVANEGCYGVPHSWRDTPELPKVDITPGCYRETLAWARELGKLIPWG